MVSPPPAHPPLLVAPSGLATSTSFPMCPSTRTPPPPWTHAPPPVSRSLAAFPGALAEPPRVGGGLAELGPSSEGGEGGAGAPQPQGRPGYQPRPSQAPPLAGPAPALAAARPRQAEPQEHRGGGGEEGGERAVRPWLPGAGLGGAFFFSQFPLAGSRKPGAAGRSGRDAEAAQESPRGARRSSRGSSVRAEPHAAAPPLLRRKPAQPPPRPDPRPRSRLPDPRGPIPAPRPPLPPPPNFHRPSAARPLDPVVGVARAPAPGCPPQPGGGVPVPGPRSRGGRPWQGPGGWQRGGHPACLAHPHSLPLASASLPSPRGADGSSAGAWAEDRGGRPGRLG
nr:translation initiation factor IF-2-like [Equus asinus]